MTRRSRERRFYDAEAGELDAAALPPGPLDDYDRALLGAIGDVDGLRVLELGCGRGDLSLELLARGARLTALDLSLPMVSLARERAERYRPDAEATFAVAAIEDTGLPAESFDLLVGKWILHHADVARAARELERLLVPGGRGAFFENQARNPMLVAARRGVWGLGALNRVGTADERPLAEDDLAALRSVFERVELAYPSLYLFEPVGRALGHRAVRQLRSVDSALWRRVPRLRPYGYHVLITVAKRG